MKQNEQPLYPKLSPIYNKILQLISAILLIIALLSILHAIALKKENDLTEHFIFIGKQQLQQAIAGAAVIFELESVNQAKQKRLMQQYLDGLTRVNFVKEAHLYDATGLLLVSSAEVKFDQQNNLVAPLTALSINELYGINRDKENVTTSLQGQSLSPFIAEIPLSDGTNDRLHGYLRLTIEPSLLTKILAKADQEQASLNRLMLLFAGFVGFLLTRGLNRFSRRGYRLHSAKSQ